MNAWRRTTRWSLRSLSQLPLNKETAQALLHDTSLRLEGQSHFLQELKDSLANTRNAHNSSGKKHGFISASNTPVTSNLLDWKGHLEREHQEQRIVSDAVKILSNLQVLHSDTQQLTTQLLHSDRLWIEFSNAHQNLVAATMEQIRSRHASTLETMADLKTLVRRLSALTMSSPSSHSLLHSCQPNMTHFLRGRLAVQILCDHYVTLAKQHKNQQKNKAKNTTTTATPFTGGISVNCSLEPILQEAKTEATALCDAHYQISPEIQLPTMFDGAASSITLVRPWVTHALVEVFKNAMVASMDAADSSSSSTAPPPIVVEIMNDESNTRQGSGFVKVCVHDFGAGLPPESSDHGSSTTTSTTDLPPEDVVFEFASNTDNRWDRLQVQQSYASVRSPLSSMGVGVPSSQWLLQHFGGDLELHNRTATANDEGGCTATLLLPRDDDICEYVPLPQDQT